jgi:hypothetical protein
LFDAERHSHVHPRHRPIAACLLAFVFLHQAGPQGESRSIAEPVVRTQALPGHEELAKQLASTYLEDPAAALALARRAAADTDPLVRAVFVHWIHDVVARQFVPTSGAHAERVRPLLDALAERTDLDGFTVSTTAGLRTWVEAQATDDAQKLLRLAQATYPRYESYGGRYLLLLANVLDGREEPELQAVARRIRERLMTGVTDKMKGMTRPEFDQPYGTIHYWFSYASDREAERCRREMQFVKDAKARADLRVRAFMHRSNAASVNLNATRRAATWWLHEATVMSGPKEFHTLVARNHEDRAAEFHQAGAATDAAQAIGFALDKFADATLVDGSLLPVLEEASTRLRPGSQWHKVWSERVLGFAPRFPFDAVTSAGDQKRPIEPLHERWRVFFVSDPSCRFCDAAHKSIETLSKEFAGAVLVATSTRDHATLPGAAVISDEGLTKLDVSPGIPYVIAPDGRYARLSLLRWEQMGRTFLSLPAEKSR